MRFYSTNQRSPQVSFREAIIQGMPSDNGLFMPAAIPQVSEQFMQEIPEKNFQEIAFEISRLWLEDEIPAEVIKNICFSAFDFDAPLFKIEDNIYSLELYHGPTHAFKDFGARFLSRLIAYFNKDEQKETVVLVATSGDTGSAVAHGFYQVPGVYIVLLYPSGKVSHLQEKQITTLGGNVTALEVNGTFDDCQMLVKQAFLDDSLTDIMNLTSANSINFGRLLPQSIYYFYAFAQLAAMKRPIMFSVPSGNFGNLTAGLLAKKMGLPVHKFIAATNANNIFPKYLETGDFSPKPSRKTISNAMDVGNPSNFARITELYNQNLESIRKDIVSTAYSDYITRKAIVQVFDSTHYLLCPHSAIGYLGVRDYLMGLDTEYNGVFLSTAHPAKFHNVINEFLDYDIAFPHGLKNVLSKEKKSLPFESDYAALRDFLLKAGWRKSGS